MSATISDLIVHICPHQSWEAALNRGTYRSDSLEREGFIHCSRPEQVLNVANHLYQGQPDLLLLWIDPRMVKAEIRWESVGNETFPHIYGALGIEAVIAAMPFTPDEDDVFRQLPAPAI